MGRIGANSKALLVFLLMVKLKSIAIVMIGITYDFKCLSLYLAIF